MSNLIPPDRETSQEKFVRISKWPGVVVHLNPDPKPFVPDDTVRLREGITIREILGKDDDGDE